MPKQEIVGREEIVGLEEIVGASLKDVAAAPLKLAKKVVTLPFSAAEWALRKSPSPNKSWFIGREEIVGAEDAELVSLMNKNLTEAKSDSDVVRAYLLAIASDSQRMANVNRLASAGNRKAQTLLALIQKAGRPQTKVMGAFVGEDERILAREGSRSDGAALARRAASCGYNSHWAYIRGDGPGLTAADLAKVQKLADGGNKKAQKLIARLRKLAVANVSGEAGPKPDTSSSRREAKQILEVANSAKSISRAALRRAIWLYAGKSSTESERTAVGKKMISLLNERQVRLTN